MKVFKKLMKSWLKVSELSVDRWRASEGMLDPASDRIFRFRFAIYNLIQTLRFCLGAPLWFLRLPYQILSLLREFEILHFSPMRKMKKGKGCVIDRQTWLINGQNIILGEFVKLSAYSSLMAGNASTITIGSNTIMSTGVVIVSFNHGYALNGIPMRYQPWIDIRENSIEIGSDVWIGANVTILPGSRVGDGAIIGAGTTVKGTVPPYSIYLAKFESRVISREPPRNVFQ